MRSASTPGSDYDTHFKQQKALGAECSGLIYYDMRHKVNIKKGSTTRLGEKILPEGAPELSSPGMKVEFYDETTGIHTIRQGRHLHDLETLTPYLDPYFHILDYTIICYDEENYFLSVIAERK